MPALNRRRRAGNEAAVPRLVKEAKEALAPVIAVAKRSTEPPDRSALDVDIITIQKEELDRLEQENFELRQENVALHAKIEQLQTKMTRVTTSRKKRR